MQRARRWSGGSFFLLLLCLGSKWPNKTLFVGSFCPLFTLSRRPFVSSKAERWPRVRPGVTTRPPAQTHASQPAKWISIRGAVAHSRCLLDSACGHRCRDFPPPRYDDDNNRQTTEAKSFWFRKRMNRLWKLTPAGEAVVLYLSRSNNYYSLFFLLYKLETMFVSFVLKSLYKIRTLFEVIHL